MVRNPGGRVVARFSLDIRRLEQLCVTWHRPAGRFNVLLSIFSSFGKSNSLRYFSPFIFIPDSTKMIDVLPNYTFITPEVSVREQNKTKRKNRPTVHSRFCTFVFLGLYLPEKLFIWYRIWPQLAMNNFKQSVKKRAKTNRNSRFRSDFPNAPFFLTHPVG